KFAKRHGLLGIPLQERAEVRHLIQCKTVIGMFLEQTDRRQNVWQAHLKIFLARLEHRAFPVRVWNDPKGWLLGRCQLGRPSEPRQGKDRQEKSTSKKGQG